jgi:hypothetical protein
MFPGQLQLATDRVAAAFESTIFSIRDPAVFTQNFNSAERGWPDVQERTGAMAVTCVPPVDLYALIFLLPFHLAIGHLHCGCQTPQFV